MDPGISLEKLATLREGLVSCLKLLRSSRRAQGEAPKLQNGYERIELVESLGAGQAIDAYCLQCDVVWPISAQERVLIARGITTPLHEPPLSLRKRLP